MRFFTEKIPSIKLKSSDGQIFEVDVKVASMSGTIKNILNSLEDDDDHQPIPLKVTGSVLKTILQWMSFYKDNPPFVNDHREGAESITTDDICEWEEELLTIDYKCLFEIVNAACDLDINGLKDVVCKIIANEIKGKTLRQIRNIFNRSNIM